MDAGKAVYNGIHNVVRASNGDLYVSDTRNNLIRKIDGKTKTLGRFHAEQEAARRDVRGDEHLR